MALTQDGANTPSAEIALDQLSVDALESRERVLAETLSKTRVIRICPRWLALMTPCQSARIEALVRLRTRELSATLQVRSAD